MKKVRTIILIILIVLSAMVLLGQIWPEGASPFAGIVNITFLSFSMLYFILALIKKYKEKKVN